ncbi:MAG: hypothetical protein AB1705_15480, partial [Verrucomicrobiota bacterium]
MPVPPPLPPQIPPDSEDSFAHKAAVWGLVAPVIAFGLSAVLGSLAKTGTSAVSSREGALAVFAVTASVAASGLIAAFIALCGIARHGPRGLVGKGLAGLIISSGFLVLLGYGFATGVRNAQARKNLKQELAEMEEHARKSYDSEKGLPVDAERATKLRTQMEKASKEMRGNEAKVVAAGAAVMRRMESAALAYQKVYQQFEAADVLNPGSSRTTEQIQRKRV